MATMQDVARRAGVAVSTVSYALSGARPVARATAERIRQAMEELNYEPNAMARGLARRRSYTLATSVPDFDPAMGDTVFGIVNGVQRAASAKGYHVATWLVSPDNAGEELVTIVRQGKADGVVLLEVEMHDARVAALEEAGVPFVLAGRTARCESHAYVDIDFEHTVEEAIDTLYNLGHRRIAFIGRPESQLESGYGPAVRSRNAYKEHIAALGLASAAVECDASAIAGRRLAYKLWEHPARPTGIVIMNDMAALGLLAAFNEMGLNIPGDISVLGVVSSRSMSAMTYPPLSTSFGPGEAMGAYAATTLISIIEDGVKPASCQRLVRCIQGPGGSLGPAPQATTEMIPATS